MMTGCNPEMERYVCIISPRSEYIVLSVSLPLHNRHLCSFASRPCIVIDGIYKQEIKNLMDLFQETDGCAGI